MAWLLADDIVYTTHNKIENSIINSSGAQTGVEAPYQVQPMTKLG